MVRSQGLTAVFQRIGSYGMWRCVAGLLVPDVSKHRNAFIFTSHGFQIQPCLVLVTAQRNPNCNNVITDASDLVFITLLKVKMKIGLAAVFQLATPNFPPHWPTYNSVIIRQQTRHKCLQLAKHDKVHKKVHVLKEIFTYKENNGWKRIDQCPVAPQTFLEEPHGRDRSARRYKEISSWSAAP